jgi:hypothetical protein
MAKKSVKITETVEEVTPAEKKEEIKVAAEKKDEELAADLTEKNEKKEPEKKPDVKPETKAEAPKVEAPKVDDDDDISYIKQTLAKQMIDALDVDTLKKFIVECEGKSLKAKAEWISKNKPVASPDPAKGLPKGAAGGKPLGPYDPGYKHEFAKNPRYIG